MDENKAMYSACLFLAIYLKYGRHWVAHQYSAVRSIEKKKSALKCMSTRHFQS